MEVWKINFGIEVREMDGIFKGPRPGRGEISTKSKEQKS
jgi:hypothetical protein